MSEWKGRRYRVSESHLRRLRQEGLGCSQIAKIYGCDPSTVRFWLQKFGIPPAGPIVSLKDADIDRAIERFGRKHG